MAKKTINDLHVLLVEQNGNINTLLTEVRILSAQLDKHEVNDNAEHLGYIKE